MATGKPNPRRIPRSQADVDRARQEGLNLGADIMRNMFLYVLLDKHNASQEELTIFAREVNNLADSINRGYVSYLDIEKTLESDYDLTCEPLHRKP